MYQRRINFKVSISTDLPPSSRSFLIVCSEVEGMTPRICVLERLHRSGVVVANNAMVSLRAQIHELSLDTAGCTCVQLQPASGIQPTFQPFCRALDAFNR